MRINLVKTYRKGSAAIGVIIGVSIVMTAGLLFYCWKQLVPALNSAYQSKLQLKSEVAELEIKIDELQKAQSIVNRIKPSLSSLELALPNNSQFPEILVSISVMAQGSGLTKVSTLDIGTNDTAANNTDSYKPSTFSITASGLYENAIVFLDNLYNNIRTVEIDSISFTTEAESGNNDEGSTAVPGQLNFTFSGFTYSRPDTVGAATPDSTNSASTTNSPNNNSSNTTSPNNSTVNK